MRTIDTRAVLLGTSAAAAIALPFGLAGQLVVGDEDSSLVVFAFLVPVLVAFVAGGLVAARRASSAPLTNGALAALGAFALIQGVGALRRLATGEPLSVASLAFAALLAYSCGLLGAFLAERLGPGRRGRGERARRRGVSGASDATR